MAAVVRVKRRRCDDPVEALYLSCVSKRAKRELPSGGDAEEVTSILRLAATVPTKDEPVYSKIQHAISKEQLQKEFKQHAVDIRGKMRMEMRNSVQAGRYKVVSRHRELETSDSPQEDCEDNGAGAQTSKSVSGEGKVCKVKGNTQEAENETATSGQRDGAGGDDGAGSERGSAGGAVRAPGSASHSDDSNLWIYDVEVEPQETASRSTHRGSQVSPRRQAVSNDPHAQLSNIMCNGVQMVATNEGANNDYVYDLYYATQGIGTEAAVESMKIEAFLDLFEYRSSIQDEEVASNADSEDSNAEDNWRNDYPDEEEGEESGEEDFEGNRVPNYRRAGLDAEDADPDYADLPQSVVDQLYIDGSTYGGGRKPRPRHHYFSSHGRNSENEDDEDNDDCCYEQNYDEDDNEENTMLD